MRWRIRRRIGAVGLLWNRPSDAWLNSWGLKAPQRSRAFEELLEGGEILEVSVEGIKHLLYCRAGDLPLLDRVRQGEAFKPRCELIAPLDCMMWDRNLIRALFGFDYTWEIYTPAAKRKYGHYVLPMIWGGRFAGRVEAVAEAKTGRLVVKNIWYEDGVRRTKKAGKRGERVSEAPWNIQSLPGDCAPGGGEAGVRRIDRRGFSQACAPGRKKRAPRP